MHRYIYFFSSEIMLAPPKLSRLIRTVKWQTGDSNAMTKGTTLEPQCRYVYAFN